MVLRMIQPMTITVWPARYRPVPRNRARDSEYRPNASASYSDGTRPAPRGIDRSERSLRPSRDRRAMGYDPPVLVRRQPAGSRWSSTSSTVTAPSRRPCSSHTATAMKL